MVYYRKRNFMRYRPKRRAAITRRGRGVRVTNFFRTPFSLPGIHNFKRTKYASFNISDWASIYNFTNQLNTPFQLDQTPNSSEITDLFDQYRIMGVSVKFVYMADSSTPIPISLAGTADIALPHIGWVKDYDDNDALAVRDDYMQYENFKTRRLDKPFSIMLYPRLSRNVYGGLTAAYALDNRKAWVDCNTADAQYYGFKFYIDPIIYGAGLHVIGKVDCYFTYYIQCKNSR